MHKSDNWKRAAAAALSAVLLMGALTGCNAKKDPGPGDTSAETGVTGDASDFETKPDGFVDNEIDPSDYTEEELYFTDAGKNVIIGVNDGNTYYGGTPLQTRFAVNMISSGEGSTAGLPADAIRDRVDYVRFGGMQYKLADLVRPRTDGLAVLKMLGDDFGIDIYGADEDGNVQMLQTGIKGLDGDGLRETYSERADFEDYTVCVHYLHACMHGMAESDYEKCVETLKSKYGITYSSMLDGTLAVMMYYDTEGNDLFYAIAAAAPGYWESPEAFAENPDGQTTHDITNCCMVLDGDHPVGFVNQVFIRCDQDVPFGEAGETADGTDSGRSPDAAGQDGVAGGSGSDGSNGAAEPGSGAGAEE